MPLSTSVRLPLARAVLLSGTAPPGSRLLCEMRPTCQSWQTMRPPRACTASVTRRQACTCPALCRPGVSM